jgi:ABC-type bacteriocin/lantibiotic exporter with double-glycine peptidase domain
MFSYTFPTRAWKWAILKNRRLRKRCVVIAHRPETIRSADRVIELGVNRNETVR